MSAVINGLKERFFDVDPGDEDVPSAWVRNQKARDYRNEMRAKADLKKQAQDKLVQKMAQQANEAAQKRQTQSDLVSKAILGKRKASQPFPLGEAILEKKRKEMEKVVGIQVEVDKKEKELERLYEKRKGALDALRNLDIEDDDTP